MPRYTTHVHYMTPTGERTILTVLLEEDSEETAERTALSNAMAKEDFASVIKVEVRPSKWWPIPD